jgi:hypothetical protein
VRNFTTVTIRQKKFIFSQLKPDSTFCPEDGVSTFLTNQLIPWDRVLLENLIVPNPVKKSPEFYRIGKLTAVFTTHKHFSVS